MRHHAFFDPISLADHPALIARRDVTRFVSGPVFFDRGVQKAASQNSKTDIANANTFGSRATDIYGNVVPGLEQDANNPTGFTPIEKSSIVTSTGEALGGVNSGATGEAKLNAMRTRNASGFAPALAESARAQGRNQASANLRTNIADAQLARQKQEQARQMLVGLYGVDTSDMLKSMNLSDEALQTQLAAGRQGWQQNAMNWIDTVSGARKAFGGGGGGGGGSNG